MAYVKIEFSATTNYDTYHEGFAFYAAEDWDQLYNKLPKVEIDFEVPINDHEWILLEEGHDWDTTYTRKMISPAEYEVLLGLFPHRCYGNYWEPEGVAAAYNLHKGYTNV